MRMLNSRQHLESSAIKMLSTVVKSMKKAKDMVGESWFMIAVESMKDFGTAIEGKALVLNSTPMEMSIRANFKTQNLKAMASTSGPRVITMKESGSRVRGMGKGSGEHILGKFMRVTGSKVRRRAMAPCTGLMVIPTLDIG